MAMSVLLEVWGSLRGEWRCVYKEDGLVCVTHTGVTRMLLLCADNWATLQQVCDLKLLTIDIHTYFILSMVSHYVCSCISLEWDDGLICMPVCVKSVRGSGLHYTQLHSHLPFGLSRFSVWGMQVLFSCFYTNILNHYCLSGVVHYSHRCCSLHF